MRGGDLADEELVRDETRSSNASAALRCDTTLSLTTLLRADAETSAANAAVAANDAGLLDDAASTLGVHSTDAADAQPDKA